MQPKGSMTWRLILALWLVGLGGIALMTVVRQAKSSRLPVVAGQSPLSPRGAGLFANPLIITNAAVNVHAVYAADIDGDGDVDVLSASLDDDKLAWYENNGALLPAFITHTVTTNAGGALAIDVADLDNDGDLDILAAAERDNQVVWYENEAIFPPTFGTTHTLAPDATGVFAIHAADVDGDTDTDVMAALQGSHTIAWYENSGGIFESHTITTAAQNAHAVYAADINGDNYLDVLSASFGDNTIAWYANDGGVPSTFVGYRIPDAALGAESVYAADLDNDADTDIISASWFDDKIAWYENDGATPPTFTAHMIANNADGAYVVRVADIDNDGDVDVISASHLDNKIAWYENDGATPPNFSPHVITTNALGVTTIAVVDLDKDGDMDILFGAADANQVGWYPNLLLPLPAFNEVAVSITGVGDGAALWGDYDNDSDLDILLTGYDTGYVTKIYRNDGETFTDIGNPLVGVRYSSAAWGDYDNDGDLDILLIGWNGGYVSKIYRNDEGSFVDAGIVLPGIHWGGVDWGDYDNDGDLDVLMVGWTGQGDIARVYRNDDGIFTDIQAGLIGTVWGDVAWGDYDNDGDLDILLSGWPHADTILKIYTNNGGIFTELEADLGVSDHGTLAWGDYDNDGDLDILFTSCTGDNCSVLVTKIYNNNAATFEDINVVMGVGWGANAWGDYDNDGDLDVLLAGQTSLNSAVTKIYRNDGANTFTEISENFTGVKNSSVAWGDYDNDGDLDLLLSGYDDFGNSISKVYRNNITATNILPIAPYGLVAQTFNKVTLLSWNAATDAQTPSAGLTYNLRVGTTPGGSDVVAPMANLDTGYRHIPAIGNAQHGLTATLRNLLPDRTYYWSVQAIDTAFAGSPFAPESSFYVPVPPDNLTIEGAPQGVIHTAQTFTATVAPVTTTMPITYTWTPEPDTGQGTSVVTYTWHTAGVQTLEVAAENIAGAISRTFTVTVNVPPTRITLAAPQVGAINTAYTFAATVLPPTTTLPITYIWQTGGESPIVHPAQDSYSDTVSFVWYTTGQKRVTVTAINRAGEVSATHTLAIETAVENVRVAGPTIGAIHRPYTFTAILDQETVLLPITYTWSPEPDAGQGDPIVTYTWTTAGQHLLYVTARNALGAASGYHDITLTTPPTAVTLIGPLTGIVQTAYPFTASVSPPEATLFMTYTWSPAPQSGQGSPFATYLWDIAGRKQIRVIAANPGGAVVGYHSLTLSARVYLPLVLRGWPQPPGRPTLYPLEKIADGAYRVRWSESPQRFAETYTLQEAPNATFTSNALTVCLTTQQACTLTQRSPGTYYYRVRGQNTFGHSEWSNVESVVIPNYPIRCSVQITTTDQAPFGNHNFDTAASIAPYLGQSLLDTADTVPPTTTASIPTRSDFYRLDNVLRNYQYTIQAKPDRTTNYNLGIIVYDDSRHPIYTDTDTSSFAASITFIACNAGPYYIEVSQITAQCSGGTYQLLYQTPVAPTPTPIPSTLPVGIQVRFLGSEKGMHLEGVVTASESRAVLSDGDGNTFYPYGVFVVALLDMTNHGLESDLITLTDSFKLQDGAGHKFDMAEAAIQQAAADTFDRPSAPFRIQPGFTVPMVFVFDALPGAQGLQLVAVNPW